MSLYVYELNGICLYMYELFTIMSLWVWTVCYMSTLDINFTLYVSTGIYGVLFVSMCMNFIGINFMLYVTTGINFTLYVTTGINFMLYVTTGMNFQLYVSIG